VIARQAGCRKAVTLTTSRGGAADSGAEIAAMLGLPCREFPRFATGVEQRGKRDYVVGDSSVSTDILRRFDDFLSSIVTPEDAVFAAFEPLLRNAIFFSGWYGDVIWATGGDHRPNVVRGDNSGAGLDAFRQRVALSMCRCPSLPAGMRVRSKRLRIQTRYLPSELAARTIVRFRAGSAKRLAWREAR
jgi:hypothetical protein